MGCCLQRTVQGTGGGDKATEDLLQEITQKEENARQEDEQKVAMRAQARLAKQRLTEEILNKQKQQLEEVQQ